MTASPPDLAAIRRAFHSDVGYRRLVSDRARNVLDAMVDDPGFLGSTDPAALVTVAALVAGARPRRVLELGTLVGFSTVVIADVLVAAGGGRVTSVDPNREAQRTAKRWIAAAGLERHAEFVLGASTEPAVVRRLVAGGPFDLIYLDSSHTYDGTLAELALLLEGPRLLAEHGLLVLHDAARAAAAYDPTARGGVRRALDEWLDARPGGYSALVLEPPFWPYPCGLGLVSRRAASGAQPRSEAPVSAAARNAAIPPAGDSGGAPRIG